MQSIDSWLKRVARPGLILLAVLVLGAVLIACGGGDDEEGAGDAATSTATSSGARGATATSTTTAGSPTPGSSADGTPVGTEKGNQIAAASMPAVEDLPGSGWSVTATDEFAGSLLDAQDSELTDTPACGPYVKKITDAAKKAQEARVGRASRTFGQQSALFGTSVDVEVAVYKDSKTASTLISEAKGAFNSSDFENCFREVLKGSEGGVPQDVKFELKAGKPLTSAPHSGIAQAYDISLSSAGVSFALHAEVYAWADKNATAIVSVFGAPDEVKADVVKAVVSKTDEKVSKAQ